MTACEGGRPRTLRDWAAVLAVALGLAAVLELVGVPSATLIAGLITGLGRALLIRRPAALPQHAMTGAQAVVGVSIGALVSVSTVQVLRLVVMLLTAPLVSTLLQRGR